MKARHKPLLLILVKRTVIFCFVICLVSLFYWAVGSERAFLDETEFMLLNLARLSSLGLVVSSGLGALVAGGFALARRYSLRPRGLLGYAAAAALGAVVLLLSQTLTILSHGLH
jgi:hypothetical protein